MTDVVANANGEPTWFVARPHELRQSLAAIPDGVLLDAFRRAWHGKPPRRTADGLRRRIAAIHRRHLRHSKETKLLPLLQAARVLGLSSRTLRRQIEDGTREALYIGSGGSRALAAEVPADDELHRFRLIPASMRPDPRVAARDDQ